MAAAIRAPNLFDKHQRDVADSPSIRRAHPATGSPDVPTASHPLGLNVPFRGTHLAHPARSDFVRSSCRSVTASSMKPALPHMSTPIPVGCGSGGVER